MKLNAPLFIIEEYTKVFQVTYGTYKVIVFDERRRDVIVSYTNNTSAYDRIVYDYRLNPKRCSGSYTLRQAYSAILSVHQISILNSNYSLYKS